MPRHQTNGSLLALGIIALLVGIVLGFIGVKDAPEWYFWILGASISFFIARILIEAA